VRVLPFGLGALVCTVSIAEGATAQRTGVSGVVIEELTRTPVPGATIHLLSDSARAIATTTTDAIGRFRFDVPAPGVYQVRVDRLGFQRQESPRLTVKAGRVEVIQLELVRRPIVLDSVLIRSETDTKPVGALQQLIHGRLLDDDTGEPIPDGTIELRDSRKKSAAKVVTDANGRFRLVTPSPGTYSLYGERPDYKPAEQTDLRMQLGDTVVLEFRLSRRAVLLAPVLVTESAKPWMERDKRGRMQDLYDRMKRFGSARYATFILRDTIEAYDRRDFTLGDMLYRSIKRPPPDPRACVGGHVFVDGFPWEAQGGSLSDFWPLNTIDVIEVYTHPTIPAEFASPTSNPGARSSMRRPCQVISVWTRPREKR